MPAFQFRAPLPLCWPPGNFPCASPASEKLSIRKTIYSTVTTIELAQCGSLDEAIAFVEGIARQSRIVTGDDDAIGFQPRLFVVVDGEHRQVLAGEPWQRGIRWCDPVASDGEARLVVAKASKLRGEASLEAGWDNHSTARVLRFRASVLEGRLVHPDWRQTVRAALFQAA